MAERIRVLHIVQNLNFGGMERIIAELARRTDSSAFEVHVLALQYVGYFGENLERYATVHLHPPMSRWSMIRPSALAASIKSINPHVAHLHSGVWFKAARAAAIAGVPHVIYTDHGRQNPDPFIYRTLDRFAAGKTDIVVAVSEKLEQDMRKFISGDVDLRVVANGVDTDLYAPTKVERTLPAEIGFDANRPIIGSVGRLEAIKGYEVMVDSFAKLLASYPSIQPKPFLVLIGDGSQRLSLEKQAQSLGISDHIAFLGWRSDIESLLHQFDLFSMSSHSEGTSVSLLESMSAGLCPVVTDVGGNRAVLGPDLAHRLAQPANPESLASNWADALQNPDKLAADSASARKRVVEHFGLDSMVKRYEALYRER